MQTCNHCGQRKPESEYHVNGGKLARTCKECVNAKRRDKRAAEHMDAPDAARARLNHSDYRPVQQLICRQWVTI